MNPLQNMTVAEKIVWLFQHRVTEAHRSSIEKPLKIEAEDFDSAIARARDLGVDVGLRITPIYEREGWWTSDPTQRLAAVAVKETLKRNQGEAERHARVYAGFGDLDGFTKWDRAALEGRITAFLENLGQVHVTEDVDYVIDRVDGAIERGHGYVERERLAA